MNRSSKFPTMSTIKSYIYKITNFSFVSKIYNKENIRAQKVFKFTTNSELKNELKNKEKYAQNLTMIKELSEKIKIEDRLTYTTEGTKEEKKYMIMMKKDSEERESTLEEDFKPVNIVHKNKRNELQQQLKKLRAENETIKAKYLKYIQEDKSEEYDVIRASTIKDLFSQSYSFNNRFLNSQFYESVNKMDIDKPLKVRLEEEEVSLKQHNLEAEISDVLNDMINKDMASFDIEKTSIPQKLAGRPIRRSTPADLNQPSILLVEGDLNVNYDLNLEYERLVNLSNPSDDFGKKIKEEQEKEEEKEADIKEEDTNLFNEGNQPEIHNPDLSITKA